jgi:hypothetical protein
MRIRVSVRVRMKVRVRVRARTLDIEAICSNHGKDFVGRILYVHKNVVLVQKGVFGLRGYIVRVRIKGEGQGDDEGADKGLG